jgi:hypothetical protein
LFLCLKKVCYRDCGNWKEWTKKTIYYLNEVKAASIPRTVGGTQWHISDISDLSSHHPSSVDWHASQEQKVQSQRVMQEDPLREGLRYQIFDNRVARGNDGKIKEEDVSAKIASQRLSANYN